jgi:UDP:flavonoid glycosyltransferase YjiC (YdhE family)
LTRPSRPALSRLGGSRRIVFATIGSFGDLHPYLALALELNRRGHRAEIATSTVYRARIEALGIGFHPLGPDFDRIQSVPGLVEQVLHPRTGAESLIRDVVMPSLRESFADLAAAARGADLLVSHPLTFTARLVAETNPGLGWASTFLAPFTAFSAYDPSVMAEIPFLGALRPLGPTLFRQIHKLVIKRAREWSAPWNDLRAELGLPPAPDPLFADQHAPALALGLFSPLLGQPQPDWPQNSRATGFPFFDAEAQAGLPPELDDFLRAGPAPVVFTLGTAMVRRPGRFFEDSLAAARRLGRRAVIMIGRDSTLPPGPLAEGAFAAAYAPFPLLFPRAAAIVHHGGIGTTAQAMRAGRPMLVVPFGFDQPDNAARVTRLGIARTLPIGSYSAAHASTALAGLLESQASRQRSAAIAGAIAGEDGTRAACDALLGII